MRAAGGACCPAPEASSGRNEGGKRRRDNVGGLDPKMAMWRGTVTIGNETNHDDNDDDEDEDETRPTHHQIMIIACRSIDTLFYHMLMMILTHPTTVRR